MNLLTIRIVGRSLCSVSVCLLLVGVCKDLLCVLTEYCVLLQKLPSIRSLPSCSPADLSFGWTRATCAPLPDNGGDDDDVDEDDFEGDMDTSI